MTTKILVIGIAATLLATGCATREPKPFAAGKDCFYPACTISVEVVDDGNGGKKLKVEDDGNIIMGTRHRLVAIVWNLRTPGYEFRGDSIRPHVGRLGENKPATNQGDWDQQIIPHANWYDSYSVTNHNSDRSTLSYDITVYPSHGTTGPPLSLNPVIANDAFQGRDHGFLMMK